MEGSVYRTLSAFYFFYYASLGVWAPYWGIYLQDGGFDAQYIGISFAVMLVSRILGATLWGWIQSLGILTTHLIRFALLGALIAALLLVWVDSGWSILLALGAMGLCLSGVLPQFESLTLIRLKHVPERYSWVRIWGSVGFIVSVLIAGFAFVHISIQWLPVFIAATVIGSTVAGFSINGDGLQATHNNKTLTSTLSLLAKPYVLAFFMACILVQLSHSPYYAFYSIFLTAEGYSPYWIGVLWSLGVLAEIILFLWAPRFLSRFMMQLLLTSVALTALRWLMIALSDGEGWILTMAQLLHAASFAGFHAAAIEWLRRVFHDEATMHSGQVIYNVVGFGVGGTIGAYMSGLLWSQYGATTLYLMAAIAASCAWLLLLLTQRNKAMSPLKL